MTNHEKLQEDYENSLFALLMDEFAQSEGERLMKENSRLTLDETAAVPRDIERRCLLLIERETSKRTRSKSAAGFLHFLARMALSALIAVMLFGAAYALSPAIRAGTLNLLMQIDERAASWQFMKESDDPSEAPVGLPVITIGWLPEEYSITRQNNNGRFSANVICESESGRTITISVFFGGTSNYTIDIEDADYCNDIIIQDMPGKQIMKDGSIRILWVDDTVGCVIRVLSKDEDSNTLIRIANSISF